MAGSLELETGAGAIALEDGTGVLLLEVPLTPLGETLSDVRVYTGSVDDIPGH